MNLLGIILDVGIILCQVTLLRNTYNRFDVGNAEKALFRC